MTKPKSRSKPYPGTYLVKSTGEWRYSFDGPRHPDGRRNQITDRGYATQRLAFEAREQHRYELRTRNGDEPTDDTLEDYFTRWMRDTAHGRRASTNGNYVRAWRFFPEPFRLIKLVELTPAQVRTAYAGIVQTYAASTCKFARTVLVMALKAAHRDRLIPYNPAEGIKLPVSQDAEQEAAFDPKNVWSIEETNRFLARTTDHPDHALWRLLLDSGLRIGEALALTWEDIDLTERRVRVLRTTTLDAYGREVMGAQPKTRTSRREVGIQSETVDALRRYQTEQRLRRLRCGALWLDRNIVFDAGDGDLMAKQRARTRFTTAVRQQGMRPLTLHGCRHTMAVTWLKAGESPAVVAKRLGHKSAAFTLDVYAKVSAEWQQSAVDRVQAFMQRTG